MTEDMAAGFYFDQMSGQYRYFDGANWTNKFTDHLPDATQAQAPSGAASPGIYFDPAEGRKRYFDGQEWTDLDPGPSGTALHAKDPSVSDIIIVGYILAVLFPIVGFIIGLTQINRNQHGIRVVVASVVAFMVWLAIIAIATSGDGGSAGYYR